MRVCLDARCLQNTATGLGRYARHLVRGLSAIDRQNEYTVLLNPAYEGSVADQENVKEVRLAGRPDTVGNFLVGARWIRRLNADIYHSLHHFLPFGIQGRAMLTLHDLIWLEHPDLAYTSAIRGRAIRLYAGITMKYSLERADHIVSISRYTADQALSRLSLDAGRVTVIPHGVDERFLGAGNRTDESTDAIGDPFFLVLGHSKPNKNVVRVIAALALLSQRVPNVRLVIAGRGEGYDELRKTVADLRLSDGVDFLTRIPDADLLDLYRTARALVFPSLVEGFGMPILEAQAAGCPVITSDRGAMPETAGDAALFVDPLDSWEIARAMERILTDPGLRSDLIGRGRRRARLFSWEATAAKTLTVYERLMAEAAAIRTLAPEPVRS